MQLLIHRLDSKHRRLFQIANAALVLGLLPWIFREYIPMNHNWLDAFCGFCMGLSVTINLFCLRAARRCQNTQA
ncbi:MAG TPA: hypothetical protein VMT38_11715 [Terracidiphilus sp.]|nr:hypothetical protein [Terracidiphilus sp.]